METQNVTSNVLCLYIFALPNLLETEDLVTFTEEILNGKLHFLYSVRSLFIFSAGLAHLCSVHNFPVLESNIFWDIVYCFQYPPPPPKDQESKGLQIFLRAVERE